MGRADRMHMKMINAYSFGWKSLRGQLRILVIEKRIISKWIFEIYGVEMGTVLAQDRA